MNPRKELLQKQINEDAETIKTLNTRASTEGRTELTEDEQKTYDEALNRAQSNKVAFDKEDSADKLFASVAPATVATGIVEVVNDHGLTTRASKSEEIKNYFATYGKAEIDGEFDARQKMRALVTTGTSAGHMPYTVSDIVFEFGDTQRRVVDSLQHIPVPNQDFYVRVNTPGVTVAEQVNEGDTIVSSTSTSARVLVQTKTYAGLIKISLQAETWTSPNLLTDNLRNLAGAYARTTDTVVAANLKAAATVTQTFAYSGWTGATVVDAILQASDTVQASWGEEANTIWVSAFVKRKLAALVGSDGHPVFPYINPNNRDGSLGGAGRYSNLSILDLNVVVCPNFAGGAFIVGNSNAGIVAESMYPELRAVSPSTLSTEVAMAGELGTYFRPEGFVKLVDNGATPVYS